MLQPRKSHLLGALLIIGLTHGGCAATAPVEHSVPERVSAEFQLGEDMPVMSESHLDTLNRYVSAVAVTTAFQVPERGTEIRNCSGVLIHPQVVLTAGHCVCHERKAIPPEASDARIIDKSTCAKVASVKVFSYAVDRNGSPDRAEAEPFKVSIKKSSSYNGRVQAHDDIRILYRDIETADDVQASTEFSIADLAVIFLDQPVRERVEPVRLAEQPVWLKERVWMVGYGSNFSGSWNQEPIRRYGDNEVASIREDGTTFFVGRQYEIESSYRGERPGMVRVRGSYAEHGDSGGPCFRERKGVLELVGVAKSTLSPPVVLSSYTSVPKYLEWIRQRVAEAEAHRTE